MLLVLQQGGPSRDLVTGTRFGLKCMTMWSYLIQTSVHQLIISPLLLSRISTNLVDFNNTFIYTFIILDGRNLKSKCWQGCILSEGFMQESLCLIFGGLCKLPVFIHLWILHHIILLACFRITSPLFYSDSSTLSRPLVITSGSSIDSRMNLPLPRSLGWSHWLSSIVKEIRLKGFRLRLWTDLKIYDLVKLIKTRPFWKKINYAM